MFAICKYRGMQSASNRPALAERLRSIGISESYASQLVNRRRAPSLALALRIHRELGEKMGPISEATPAEIKALERLASKHDTAARDAA